LISDVALWFAKNTKGEIKTINEVKYHDDKYFCPLCNSEVIPKALKENSKVTEHFAHIDKSKCTPESMIHWWYKNKFIQSGDTFIVTTDKTHEYVCKDILIEEAYHTEYGDYKPDVTVITESGDTIYFEYAFTNKKKIKDYLNQWLELSNIVVEVNLKTLLQANYGKDSYDFHALFYEGKCFNTNKRDLYYKTIGEYKEKMYSDKTIDVEKKNEIEKLDWFWDSVQEYKLDKLNDEELYLCFDEASNINSNLVIDILSKSKCTQILNDCIKNKVTKIYNEVIDYANSKNQNISKLIKYNIIQYKYDRPYADISIRDLTDNCDLGINIFNYSHNEIMKHAKEAIDKDIEYYPTYLKIQEYNELINKRIEQINNSLLVGNLIEQTLKNYSNYDLKYNVSGGGAKGDIYITWWCDFSLYFIFNNVSNRVLDLRFVISDDDFNIDGMYNKLKNDISIYFNNLVKLENIDKYERLVNSINNYYYALPIEIHSSGELFSEDMFYITMSYHDLDYRNIYVHERIYFQIYKDYVKFNDEKYNDIVLSYDNNIEKLKHIILNYTAKMALKIRGEI